MYSVVPLSDPFTPDDTSWEIKSIGATVNHQIVLNRTDPGGSGIFAGLTEIGAPSQGVRADQRVGSTIFHESFYTRISFLKYQTSALEQTDYRWFGGKANVFGTFEEPAPPVLGAISCYIEPDTNSRPIVYPSTVSRAVVKCRFMVFYTKAKYTDAYALNALMGLDPDIFAYVKDEFAEEIDVVHDVAFLLSEQQPVLFRDIHIPLDLRRVDIDGNNVKSQYLNILALSQLVPFPSMNVLDIRVSVEASTRFHYTDNPFVSTLFPDEWDPRPDPRRNPIRPNNNSGVQSTTDIVIHGNRSTKRAYDDRARVLPSSSQSTALMLRQQEEERSQGGSRSKKSRTHHSPIASHTRSRDGRPVLSRIPSNENFSPPPSRRRI